MLLRLGCVFLVCFLAAVAHGGLTVNPASRAKNGNVILNGIGRTGGTTIVGGLSTNEGLNLYANPNTVNPGIISTTINFFDRINIGVPNQTLNTGIVWFTTGGSTTNTFVDTINGGTGAYEILTQTREVDFLTQPFAGAAPLFLSWPATVRVKNFTTEIDGGPTYRMGANWIADNVVASVRDSTGISIFGAFKDNRTFNVANGGSYNANSDMVSFASLPNPIVAFGQYIGFLATPIASSNLTTAIGFDSRATTAGTTNIGFRTAIVSGAGNLSFQDTGGAAWSAAGKFTKYNNIATQGLGLPGIYAETITGTQTANVTILTYTPPATAGRYRISCVITTTSSTNTGTVEATVDYKDSQGTVHTADIIPLVDAAGAIATTKTGASKEFHCVPWEISINNGATNIVPKVVITGVVSYTGAATVEQLA